MRPQDPDRLIRAVGRRIAELRVATGWTQDELAEQASFSSKYLQRIEAGSENLTLRSMVELANVLQVRLAELLVPPASTAVKRGRPPSTYKGDATLQERAAERTTPYPSKRQRRGSRSPGSTDLSFVRGTHSRRIRTA